MTVYFPQGSFGLNVVLLFFLKGDEWNCTFCKWFRKTNISSFETLSTQRHKPHQEQSTTNELSKRWIHETYFCFGTRRQRVQVQRTFSKSFSLQTGTSSLSQSIWSRQRLPSKDGGDQKRWPRPFPARSSCSAENSQQGEKQTPVYSPARQSAQLSVRITVCGSAGHFSSSMF